MGLKKIISVALAAALSMLPMTAFADEGKTSAQSEGTIKASISQSIEQQEGGKEKEVFNLKNGEKFVDCVVKTTLTSDKIQNDPITVYLKSNTANYNFFSSSTVTKGGTYVPNKTEGLEGSITGGEEVYYSVTSSQPGTQTVIIPIDGVKINVPTSDGRYAASIPDIHYSIAISNEHVKDGMEYSCGMSVSTEKSGTSSLASTSSKFRIVKDSDILAAVESQSEVELGEDLDFAISWENVTDKDREAEILCSAMPVNGDKAGTKTAGNYSVTSLKLSSTDNVKDFSKYSLYYIVVDSGKDARGYNLKKETIDSKYSNSHISGEERDWKKASVSATGEVQIGNGENEFPAKGVYAWAIIDGLKSKEKLTVDMTLKTDGSCKQGDTFVVTATSEMQKTDYSGSTSIKVDAEYPLVSKPVSGKFTPPAGSSISDYYVKMEDLNTYEKKSEYTWNSRDYSTIAIEKDGSFTINPFEFVDPETIGKDLCTYLFKISVNSYKETSSDKDLFDYYIISYATNNKNEKVDYVIVKYSKDGSTSQVTEMAINGSSSGTSNGTTQGTGTTNGNQDSTSGSTSGSTSSNTTSSSSSNNSSENTSTSSSSSSSSSSSQSTNTPTPQPTQVPASPSVSTPTGGTGTLVAKAATTQTAQKGVMVLKDTSKTSVKGSDGLPQTSDAAPIAAVALVALVSGLGALSLLAVKKKKEQ